MIANLDLPKSVGISLRSCHYSYIEAHRPDVPWFEVVSDNYLYNDGPGLLHLQKIREIYSIALHGVGMSLGSCDTLDKDYLTELKRLINFTKPSFVSDHLCWTSFNNQHFHELLPLPYTEEAVKHVAQRIKQVQDFLERRLMIENVSSYLTFKHSTMTEWEFLQTVAEEANCLILLDINNIYVSSKNCNFNPYDYLSGLATERVAQFHLGGFEDHGAYLLDTHSVTVAEEVMILFKAAISRFGLLPTLLEWDKQIPSFELLQQESKKIQKLMDDYANLS